MSVSQEYLCASCQAAFDLSLLTETDAGWLCADCAARPLTAFTPPAGTYRRATTRPRLRTQSTTNWPLVVVLIGAAAGGIVYLVTSGTAARWLGRTETVQVGETASTELQTVNRLIKQANESVANGKSADGKAQLTAARAIATAATDPTVKQMLPQLEAGLIAIDKPDHSAKPGDFMADK